MMFNPFKPEFTIVVLIHNKPLVVDGDDLKWVTNEKKILLLFKLSHKYLRSKSLRFGGIMAFFRDVECS